MTVYNDSVCRYFANEGVTVCRDKRAGKGRIGWGGYVQAGCEVTWH